MGIKASTVIAKARTLLGDISGSTGTQYLVDDLEKYLNEGQIEVVKIDLQANATRESVQIVAGTKQTLPDESLGLIDIIKNMGRTGNIVGDIVKPIGRKVLDDLYPSWHQATAKEEVKFFVYDRTVSRLTYDIYPPAVSTETHYLEIIHGELPDEITDFDNTDILDDRYDADLLDYVLFRAKSMHAEFSRSGEALAHLQRFEANVKGKM